MKQGLPPLRVGGRRGVPRSAIRLQPWLPIPP